MSGELIRYNRDQRGLTKVSEARRTMDEALAKLRGTPPPVIDARRDNSYEIISPRQARIGAGAVIDLPRICAVHNRIYMTRYVQAADGFFHYGQGIRITSKSTDQYGADTPETGTLSWSDLEDETCPWCGASGPGAVLCNVCSMNVCYGRSIADKYFHCRDECPGEGRIVGRNGSTRGLRPELSVRAGASTGRY